MNQRETKRRALIFPAIFAALAIYYTLPFLLNLHNWGVRDWDLFTAITAIPVSSLLDYFQLPFWNPYLGGGNILFHHPEVAVISPFILLHLVFGTVVGLKLQILICYFVGFWGSWKMARTLGLSNIASLLVSVAYFGSVHFALHLAEGHIPFSHFCFLPWFVHFVLSSATESGELSYFGITRSHIFAGISLALMILGNGGAIPLLYLGTFGALFFALKSIQNRSFEYFKSFVLSVLIGAALSAVKLIPMLVYLSGIGWEGSPGESIPIEALGPIFFGWEHSLYAQNFEGQLWNWHEYGAYISPLIIIMAVFALRRQWRECWPWLALALFFLLLGLGNFASFSPWSLLSHLPGFASARGTGRAFQFVILSLAIAGGIGFDQLRNEFGRGARISIGKGMLYLSLVTIIATNLVLAWPIMASAFTKPPQIVNRSPVFRNVLEKEMHVYRNFLANRGSLTTPWLSAYHPSRVLIDENDNIRSEYVLRGSAEIIKKVFTPNQITYELEAQLAGEMVIGMGYDPGWSAADGRTIKDMQGLIAFEFPSGRQSVRLYYRPPWIWTGLVVSMLALLSVAFWLVRRRRILA